MGIMLTFSHSVTEEDGRLLTLMLFLFSVSKGEESGIEVGRIGIIEMSPPYWSEGVVLHDRMRLFDLSLMPHLFCTFPVQPRLSCYSCWFRLLLKTILGRVSLSRSSSISLHLSMTTTPIWPHT